MVHPRVHHVPWLKSAALEIQISREPLVSELPVGYWLSEFLTQMKEIVAK